jgi:anti-anti-sigma factor
MSESARDPREEPHVIALEGEWDLSRGDELRSRLESACAHAHVIIDLARVSYIDSNCVAMLVSMRRRRIAKGYAAGHLVLPSGNIRLIFEATGFADLWPIAETFGEALHDLKHPGNRMASAAS